jgi:hypothetical protein
MKLKDAWDNQNAHTGKASDVVRSLSFGALALVWIFRNAANNLPKILAWPCALVLVALTCDLAQYVVAGWLWDRFIAGHEDRENITLESDIGPAPGSINTPGWALYYGKIAALVFAYASLLAFAIERIFT